MPDSPQRLALALQRATQDLQKERERVQGLMEDLHEQSRELDRLRSSVHIESNSRLLAEVALDETRDRLEMAVNAAGLALWDWQLPSTQVFLTARWGEMVDDIAMDGYWDIRGLLERVHPADSRRVQAIARALLDGRQKRAVAQFRLQTPNGWLWVESHGVIAEHDSKGQPLRLMGTHADIGERKRVEQEVTQAREMAEQASRAKSEFLANMSHEVRTPLNALMGLTRLLMESPLTAEQQSWLNLMNGSAEALLNLLNDVLDLSRIEAGRLDLENVNFALRRSLEDLSALYAEQARAKSLEWKLAIAPEVPENMQGDPGRLRQVLGNLLSNALKFTPRAGRIALTVKLESTNDGAAPKLQLQVQDSGVGIAPVLHSQIFEAFTQADASTARRYGGSGLGLAICSRLVRLMGGNIALHSELGRGSTFTVTLPLGDIQTQTPRAPESARAAGEDLAQVDQRFASLTVLLAEDHPVNELLMQHMLKRLGCTVRTARDGDQAVVEWEKGGIDLVLMDVQMPGCNGFQATQRIRALESNQHLNRTPIVAVTANAMTGDREACLAAGMDGYTPKPVTISTLIRAIDEARQRAADEIAAARESATPVATFPANTGPAAGQAIDLGKLRRRLDGDETTLRHLASALRTDLAERLLQLQNARHTQNAALAMEHAHGLKGSLGSMTAERGVRLAKGLELAALAHDWSLFERAFPLMQAEAKQIDGALAALLSAPTPDV
jgi:signal transduction histidine kinase/CheY-like chemotaxis protein/HPt (histidine-containing phosphotransfer) domain-containing protein